MDEKGNQKRHAARGFPPNCEGHDDRQMSDLDLIPSSPVPYTAELNDLGVFGDEAGSGRVIAATFPRW